MEENSKAKKVKIQFPTGLLLKKNSSAKGTEN